MTMMEYWVGEGKPLLPGELLSQTPKRYKGLLGATDLIPMTVISITPQWRWLEAPLFVPGPTTGGILAGLSDGFTDLHLRDVPNENCRASLENC